MANVSTKKQKGEEMNSKWKRQMKFLLKKRGYTSEQINEILDVAVQATFNKNLSKDSTNEPIQ